MNNEEQKDRIIELLGKGKKRPLTAAEIAAKLKIPSKSGKRLQKALNRLVASGNIIRIRNNRYSLGKSADLVAGKLSVIRSGNGFVQPADAGDEVFVKSRDMGTALPNDRVLVRLSSKMSAGGRDTGKQNGKIIRIIERSRNDIVGTLRSTGRFLSVVPIDPIYSHSFYVPKKGGAELDDRVVIRFTEWKNKHVSPEAEVVEVLGPADNPSGDTNAVIRHSNLRVDFPDEVVSEAGAVSSRMTDSGSRKDLRNSYILTIDPEKSRDFDDALSLTKDNAGNRVLGVHIADVSHFVEKGSALDKEALLRGNSVYLPDKVIPMLPEQLSNGICSLKPNEDRLAFSVMLTIDSNGKVISSSFAKTQIRSKLRLTYQQVLPVIKKNGEKKESAKRPDI
nr:RNB domain-containing ribonuclease [PVC group bacterium]